MRLRKTEPSRIIEVMILYRYALTEDKNIISIEDVTEKNRNAHYICPECERRIRPRALRSTSKTPHFYHPKYTGADALKECTGEGYLHWLSKELLAEALQEKAPFMLRRGLRETCGHENAIWSCFKDYVHNTDLTVRYPQISVEKRDGEFIPDILLANEQQEKIYIEIFTTNSCSPEKISSGTPIIEIKIEDDKTIERIIASRVIDVDDELIKLINFKSLDRETDCKGECRNPYNQKNYNYTEAKKTAPVRSVVYTTDIDAEMLMMTRDLQHIESGRYGEKAVRLLTKMVTFCKQSHERIKDYRQDTRHQGYPRLQQMIREIENRHGNQEDYKAIYREEGTLWFSRYKSEHFCIANVGLYYLQYEIKENKVSPIRQNSSFSKLVDTIKSAIDKDIEELF